MQCESTGRYELTSTPGETVRAFVPDPLPPDPPVLACGRLDGVSTLLPDPELFLYAYLRREALLSSHVLMLIDAGVLQQPLLYLSLFFKQHRNRYYELLDGVCQQGDWEAWIDFFLEGVESTASAAVATAHRQDPRDAGGTRHRPGDHRRSAQPSVRLRRLPGDPE